ncbi:methyltransferase family protein [Salinisphaera sp. C84B14]|uniref:class I SAM-dependent methyltransferase n=1 Tax=Salinisphaera sp. C84B14 TaxID=1304155 RepID=UPI00333F6062
MAHDTQRLPAENAILEAWHDNAAAWVHAIHQHGIASRRTTDRAIVDTVLDCGPERVLDIGCGEGWLLRALAAEDIACTGIDAVPELIDAAREKCVNPNVDLKVCAYEDLADAEFAEPFDMAVCNFSLLGEDSVDDALAGAARAVVPGGLLVIQTLHPLTACGDRPYIDGWRSASGACLGSGFQDDAPWYFRTLGRWLELVNSGDWRLAAVEEPLDDNHYLPASLILIAIRQPTDDDPEL